MMTNVNSTQLAKSVAVIIKLSEKWQGMSANLKLSSQCFRDFCTTAAF